MADACDEIEPIAVTIWGCDDCGTEFERIQMWRDPDNGIVCPCCKGWHIGVRRS
jgi:DNA-directed RNA polymerase subunit RPC12/RpoP